MLAINFVEQANNSATRLVDLIVQYLPGFRDHWYIQWHLFIFLQTCTNSSFDLWAEQSRQTNFTKTSQRKKVLLIIITIINVIFQIYVN